MQIGNHERRTWFTPISAFLPSLDATYSFTFRHKATRSPNLRPSSASGALSPSLLACPHHFVQVGRWPNFENAAVLQGWMLRHELYRMIHIARLKNENAAE